MRAVTRRPLSLLTALSLVLCVATLAWWARSFLPADLHVGAVDGRLVLLFCDARLTQIWESERAHVSAAEKWTQVRAGYYIRPSQFTQKVLADGTHVDLLLNAPPRLTELLGFAYARESPALTWDYRLITVPLLLPAALLAVPPALAFIAARRRRQRSRAGRCHRCGYDLRATPGRCPECGTAARVGTTS